MKNQLFIIKPGKLFCDKGTIGFIDYEGNKRVFPLKNVSEVMCFSNISLTGGVIKRMLNNELKVHFFTKYGTYRGSLTSQPLLNSKIIQNQVRFSMDNLMRIKYAQQILLSLKEGMIAVLRYFKKKNYNLDEEITNLKAITFVPSSISENMGYEAQMWRYFYGSLRKILNNFSFEKREYYPPKGEINSLISFGNSLLYAEMLSKIREVGLLPEIGFLHENNQKRFTLAIDMAEMFKPVIVFRMVVYLVNKRLITKTDFNYEGLYAFLNEEGRITFVKEFKNRLEKTFYYKELKKNMTLRSLMKVELTKLKLAIEHEKEYTSFKRWYVCL